MVKTDEQLATKSWHKTNKIIISTWTMMHINILVLIDGCLINVHRQVFHVSSRRYKHNAWLNYKTEDTCNEIGRVKLMFRSCSNYLSFNRYLFLLPLRHWQVKKKSNRTWITSNGSHWNKKIWYECQLDKSISKSQVIKF